MIGLCLCALPIGETMAQNVEQIYMKSGSIVEGYIAAQHPGKRITIQTTRATIVASSDSLRNQKTKSVPLGSLSSEWKAWAEENNRYKEEAGCKQLELSTLEFNGCTYTDVFLLERGSMIKFLDLTPNRYDFGWGDMSRIVKSKRPSNIFSGLKEVLIFIDGTKIEGQIIEQFPGKDLKVVTDSSGEVLSFKFSQVKQIITEPLSDKLDLWSQVQLLDILQVKGEDTPLKGFISSRTMSKELVFEFETGDKRTIPLGNITSFAKVPNDKYVVVEDKILKEGEILLNGEKAYFTPLQAHDEYLLLSETVSIQVSVGSIVHLDAKLANPDTPITLVKARMENITRKNGKKSETYPWPVISYQDLVQSHLALTRKTSPLGSIKVSFVAEVEGDYVLHIQGQDGYLVINVIK